MSLPQKLARGVGRPIARVLSLARHSASYPFDTPLTREIHRIERRSNEKPLQALKELPGLEKPPSHGLPGLIYQIVLHYKPKVIVELGTGAGLEALAIGKALADSGEGGPLIAVDGAPIEASLLSQRTALGLDATITPMTATHDDARDQVPRPIDLLLIDSRRPLEEVEADWEIYAPIIRPGGMVLFLGVKTLPQIRPFWRKMTRNHENHTVRRSGGLGIIRTKQQ